MFSPIGTVHRKHDPPKPVVVVADDDPAMRTFLSHALSDAGYHAHTAMDIPEAMEHVLRPAVVAVILDMLFVNSGGRSGLDILRFIRGDTVVKNLPVIVLTGFVLHREVVAEVEAHHAELWHKPVDPLELTHRLDQLVRGTVPMSPV